MFPVKRGITKIFATISCRAYNYKLQIGDTPLVPDGKGWRRNVLRSNGAVKMSKERASDLARHCTELVRKGNDFMTVWSTLLEDHTLVEGIPREKLERNRSLLRIPLVTGELLVFDSDVKEFRVQ
jgi:hypothetical protein